MHKEGESNAPSGVILSKLLCPHKPITKVLALGQHPVMPILPMHVQVEIIVLIIVVTCRGFGAQANCCLVDNECDQAHYPAADDAEGNASGHLDRCSIVEE